MSREIKFRAWDKKHNETVDVYELSFYPSGELYLVNGRPLAEFELRRYTGLKDKNGVEIYEGDIVGLVHKKHGLQNMKVIVWDETNACFDWEDANGDSWPDGFTGFYDEYGVIGNIYENPELVA